MTETERVERVENAIRAALVARQGITIIDDEPTLARAALAVMGDEAELREALAPFSEAAGIADGRMLGRYGKVDLGDDTTVAFALNITLGHLRAARAALSKGNGDG